MQRHNVRYAELRTTPRPLRDGTTRREYIETVLRVLRDFDTSKAYYSDEHPCKTGETAKEGEPSPLIPRLLLSVDRARSVEEAMEVVELAIELRAEDEWAKYVVGVDLSGNPTKGAFDSLRLGGVLRCNAGEPSHDQH